MLTIWAGIRPTQNTVEHIERTKEIKVNRLIFIFAWNGVGVFRMEIRNDNMSFHCIIYLKIKYVKMIILNTISQMLMQISACKRAPKRYYVLPQTFF